MKTVIMDRKQAESEWMDRKVKEYYPEEWARIHGTPAPLKICPDGGPSHAALKRRAREYKIKCFNGMTKDELGRAVQLREDEDLDALEELIAVARKRIKERFKNCGFNKN